MRIKHLTRVTLRQMYQMLSQSGTNKFKNKTRYKRTGKSFRQAANTFSCFIKVSAKPASFNETADIANQDRT